MKEKAWSPEFSSPEEKCDCFVSASDDEETIFGAIYGNKLFTLNIGLGKDSHAPMNLVVREFESFNTKDDIEGYFNKTMDELYSERGLRD